MNATTPTSWRQNLIHTHTIRVWGDVELLSVTSKLPDSRRQVVLRAPVHARERVDDVVRRHLAPRDETLPRLVAYGSTDGEVWALLDAPVVADLKSCIRDDAAFARDPQHAAAIHDLLEEVVSRRGVEVLERWSSSNVLVTADGEIRVLMLDTLPSDGVGGFSGEDAIANMLRHELGAFERTGREGSAVVLGRLRRALAGAVAPTSSQRLLVRDGGRQVVLPCGRALDFRRSPVSRGIICALAEAHASRPGLPVTTEQLIKATWPGERLIPHSAKNRLWVAISRLRQLGLEGTLVHENDGYLFPTQLEVDVSYR